MFIFPFDFSVSLFSGFLIIQVPAPQAARLTDVIFDFQQRRTLTSCQIMDFSLRYYNHESNKDRTGVKHK